MATISAAGEWIGSSTGELIAQINPGTGIILGRIQSGNAAKAAADAFPAWSQTDPAHRQEVLLEISRRLKARTADFAMMESLNNSRHIIAYDIMKSCSI